jgi:hypothetical protein
MSDQQTPTPPAPATPTKTKTGVGKVLAAIAGEPGKIVAFVGNEAKALAKLFAAEEPAVQAVLKQASQAVQVIKTNLNENPVVVSYLLRQINPAWTEDTLNGLLTQASKALNITQSIAAPTLAETIANLQAHANQLPDDLAHNTFFTGLFNLVGSLLSPGTAWSKVIVLGSYVYQTFIKKA